MSNNTDKKKKADSGSADEEYAAFFSGIPMDVDEDELRFFAEQFGEVLSILYPPAKPNILRIAYVYFETKQGLTNALKSNDRKRVLRGRSVNIQLNKAKNRLFGRQVRDAEAAEQDQEIDDVLNENNIDDVDIDSEGENFFRQNHLAQRGAGLVTDQYQELATNLELEEEYNIINLSRHCNQLIPLLLMIHQHSHSYS
ncbi:MAG: hypothetical protein EZS28_023354 [Streblomastix strix]|uniref:RRM domain-containing protein n=1 Tax=Streblomastix strix TaxID=222440 RepID=A0A5J4VEZ3_9EUKA|nr:MAG: hypothetical protein EZS28_023354 [Streblomastix strix]